MLLLPLAALLLIVVFWLLNQRAGLQQQIQMQALELTRLEVENARLPEFASQLLERQQQQEQLQRALAARADVITELETRLEVERESHDDKLQALESARVQLKADFQNLANRIFDEKAASFSHNSQEQLGHLLGPLRQQLGEFKQRVEDSYDTEAKDRRALHEQILQLKALNLQMSQDTVNLTQALKGENKTQGNWGEVILARVLEQSGLREGFEFETQVSLQQAGRRYQPDVIVRLPDNKDVIVDSKVSLTAYEKYCSSEDEIRRLGHLKAHLSSLRGHIRGLSDKSYEKLEGVRSLDFVLLFVPVEGAFLLALEQDQQLFSDAFARNIILVSPSTLLVTLRTIHNIWRYERQSQNSEEIARRGGELHDKFVGFIESMDDVGRHLGRAQSAFDMSRNRLYQGRGNLVSQAAMLNKLGATGKKQLPDTMLVAARESDSGGMES